MLKWRMAFRTIQSHEILSTHVEPQRLILLFSDFHGSLRSQIACYDMLVWSGFGKCNRM